MKNIIKLKSGIAALFIFVMMGFLNSCDELSGKSDWPDIYGSTWESSDGKVQFNVGPRSSSPSVVGPAGYFTVRYDNKYYSGYFPISVLFGGASDPLLYVIPGYLDEEGGVSGEIILKKKKNNKTITVEFTGTITIPAVELHKKELVAGWNDPDE